MLHLRYIKLLSLCDILDEGTRILDSIKIAKSRISEVIEPDFGLLEELLSLDVLNRRQIAKIRSEKTVYERNDALLNLLETEDQCDKFVEALQRTDQQHVVNFIKQNGGRT